MTKSAPPFATEAELVAEFLRQLTLHDSKATWTVYPETCGWDLLLVHENGMQLGIEAKLVLNAKVIDQALVGAHTRHAAYDGPDYRAVLVPRVGRQLHLGNICTAIGVGIIALRDIEPGARWTWLDLPSGSPFCNWVNWGPVERCPLPDYVPKVEAGIAAPKQLTDWKVRAIKLMIVLDRKGWVDRGDMKALGISPTRWTDAYNGFLARAQSGQYVRSDATPDYRAQLPENFAEIEADVALWGRDLDPFKQTAPDWLLQEPAR